MSSCVVFVHSLFHFVWLFVFLGGIRLSIKLSKNHFFWGFSVFQFSVFVAHQLFFHSSFLISSDSQVFVCILSLFVFVSLGVSGIIFLINLSSNHSFLSLFVILYFVFIIFCLFVIADHSIIPKDEVVVVRKGEVVAVGKAALTGREMENATNGIGVKIRHRKK